MSRQTATKKSSKVAPEAYCAHCFNLGLSESKYRSHYIRATTEPNSAVVCPELLATECKYCFKMGHTVTRCPALASQKKADQKAQYQQEAAKNKQEAAKNTQGKKQAATSTSRFAALDSDSDEEEQKPQQKVAQKQVTKKQVTPITSNNKTIDLTRDFPALTTKKATTVAAQPARSFAEMASKSKSEYEDEQFLKAKMTKRVQMPTLVRTETFRQQLPTQLSAENAEFWDALDPEEDEMEYAIKQIEAKEAEKKKSVKEMNWAAIDSDDEW